MKHIKLKPTDTTVDYRYQRDLDARRVEAMAHAWDPNLVGVPVISRRADGSCVQVDAQHRLAAANAAGHGDTPILMEVHDGLTLREEAELFLRLNGGRVGVQALDKFKARLEAHEPIALEIQGILKGLRCKITKGRQRGGIQAVQAVEAAHKHGNLKGTMMVLVAWLDGDSEAFNKVLIRAVSAFLVSYPDADPLHLAARLEDFSATKVMSQLRRETQQSIGSPVEAARFVLTEIYNRKTPKAKRVTQHTGSALAASAPS